MTGAADTGYDGQLRGAVEPLKPEWTCDYSIEEGDGGQVTITRPMPLCFVELAGDGSLVDTVIGLRGGPLPIG